MTPLLSIVIPTKNRHSTALATLSEIARIDGIEQVQVVVQDCSSDATLLDKLQARGLDRIAEYHHTGAPVSMTENWNLAMAHVRGEYVIFIGDDDAIYPDIVALCRWAQENGYDAVKSKGYSVYWHSDFPSREYAAKMRLQPYTGAVQVREAEPLVTELVTTGDRYFELPMVYYSLVRRSVLQRLHDRSGRYFGGLAPDIYSAIAVGCLIDRFAEIDYPLTITGASGPANSGRIREGMLHQHYTEYGDYEFSWLAPETWGFAASNTDNVVHALEDAGRPDLIERIHVTRVYARTIVAEPRRAMAHVRKYVRVLRRLKRSVAAGLLTLMFFITAKVVLLAVKGKEERNDELVADVESLGMAIAVQRDWLNGHGITPPVSGR